MAKNITIKKDGVSSNYYNVEALTTRDLDGGSAYWVPLDETNTGVKTISKKGTYTASADGFYAYSKVIVKGSGGATGKKKDGNVYYVTTDENGYIVQIKIPAEIRIEILPTKVEYVDGEEVSLTGILVRAYNGDGTVWQMTGYQDGIIPVSELFTEEETVRYGQDTVTVFWRRVQDYELMKAQYHIKVGASDESND